MKNMSSKSSILDPIPGSLMKHFFNDLLPVIADIVNLSFDNATVPINFKEAVVEPTLKKESLDHEAYKNFRPISNLSFISKVTEKVVASRLNNHLDEADLHKIFQSAYKKAHSKERALMRIHNDILRAIDDNECVILVLLDLLAAFDTVDHQILLTRLRNRFGISGKALSWIKSYLSDRTQFVKIGDEKSSKNNLICGVP